MAKPDIDYCIDEIGNTFVRGWAWYPARPDLPADVELISDDDQVLARATAAGFRGDLATAGKRSGWSAFEVIVPEGLPDGRYRLSVRSDGKIFGLGEPFRFGSRSFPAAERRFDTTIADSAGTRGHLDVIGPFLISGWVHGDRPPGGVGALRSIELLADGHAIASALPDQWRNDVEDLFQGDGRVGFAIPLPASLFDGDDHLFDLRWAGSNESLLRKPIALRMGTAPPPSFPQPGGSAERKTADAAIELSILVNFYDMHREAERTLTSLSRSFQRGVEDLSYEVLCIDNGSTVPMSEDSITRHGPEFRLFRPGAPHPSPVFALNEAASAARGRYLAGMIDGAHLLSPGVLGEAIAALRSERRAMVAVRHWFIGGDQRWLSTVGYSREHEDLPFAKIGWPHCGYDLFKISTPIHDSPNTWFDSMSESNCLFISAADFSTLGGYDIGFDIPGAGFANLDLFARASQLLGMTVVALIGEASFHQYHGGTTTNVTDAEKEQRVRRYARSFETLRGHSYNPVDRSMLKFRGAIHSDFAMNSRQRPSGRVRLGLTDAIRPTPVAHVFEEGARDYAATAYIESGCHRRSLWAGQPTGLAPADLLEMQQMLWNERPDVLVLKDVDAGLLGFVRSILSAIRLEGLRLIWLTVDDRGPTPPGVCRIIGDLADGTIRDRLDEEVFAAEDVCVVFQPRPDEAYPVEAMRRFAALVTAGGYLVVLGAAYGQPGLAYSRRWTSSAIRHFIRDSASFVIDPSMNAHLVTTCPSGFLRRLPNTVAGRAYDETLDVLEGV